MGELFKYPSEGQFKTLDIVGDWRLISGDLRSLSGDDCSMLVNFRSIEIALKNKEGDFEEAVLFLSTAVRSEVAYRSAEKSPDAAI